MAKISSDRFGGIPKKEVTEILNQILQEELAGVVRYTHYSMMVYGYNRIPIVSWMRAQANEALDHAHQAGEMLTTMGEHPDLKIGKMAESHKHDIGDILKESLEIESLTLALYEKLLGLVEDKSVFLEEYARQQIMAEEMHRAEVDKMLRRPGDFKSVIN